MKLSEKYPNFILAMKQSVEGTDTALVMDNSKHIGYIMSLILYKNKVGNITIELDLVSDGVILSFCTMKGIAEKAKTTSQLILDDLPIEEWKELISNTMVEHHYSQKHTEFLGSVSQELILKPKNSGCMLFFTLLLSIFGYLLFK